MKGSVIWQLILKDVRLQRMQLGIAFVTAAAALALLETKQALPVVIGATWFFVALIVLGCMLPVNNVVNERKKQNLAFAMSLPVSSRQYAFAKVTSTIGMFLVPWAALLGLALLLIDTTIPHGVIPITVVLMGLVLAGFCLVAGVAIVSESEGWTTAAIVVCNSSYGIAWYLIIRVPETAKQIGGHTAVWSGRLLTFLAAECLFIVLSIGLTVLIQSWKRDFV